SSGGDGSALCRDGARPQAPADGGACSLPPRERRRVHRYRNPRLRGHGDAGGLRRPNRRPGRGGKPGPQGGLRLGGTKMTDTARRLTALRERMRETGTDLVALGPGSHMQWLVGFHPHADERPCLLLVGPEKEAFLMPALNAEESRGHTGIPFHAWADEDGADAALKAALADVGATGAKRVALDETMRADFVLRSE